MAPRENENTHLRERPSTPPPFIPPSNATLALRPAVLPRLFDSPSYFRSLTPSSSACSVLPTGLLKLS